MQNIVTSLSFSDEISDNYSEPFVLEDAGCTKLQSKGAVFLEKKDNIGNAFMENV